jgi:hypothetical protein
MARAVAVRQRPGARAERARKLAAVAGAEHLSTGATNAQDRRRIRPAPGATVAASARDSKVDIVPDIFINGDAATDAVAPTGRLMEEPELKRSRNRAIWTVRVLTLAGVGSALGITWGFANLAEAYFSGKAPAPPPPPNVPKLAAPAQKPPPVITTIVHHAGRPPASSSAAPRPPSSGAPAAAAPPAPPACHSTPSKPC